MAASPFRIVLAKMAPTKAVTVESVGVPGPESEPEASDKAGTPPTTILSLPYDVHYLLVASLDSYGDALSLGRTNRYFRRIVDPDAMLPGPAKHSYYLGIDASARSAPNLVCFSCYSLLPPRAFGDSQRTGRKGRMAAEWGKRDYKGHRICFACAARDKLYAHLAPVKRFGIRYYLCHRCGRYGTSSRRCIDVWTTDEDGAENLVVTNRSDAGSVSSDRLRMVTACVLDIYKYSTDRVSDEVLKSFQEERGERRSGGASEDGQGSEGPSLSVPQVAAGEGSSAPSTERSPSPAFQGGPRPINPRHRLEMLPRSILRDIVSRLDYGSALRLHAVSRFFRDGFLAHAVSGVRPKPSSTWRDPLKPTARSATPCFAAQGSVGYFACTFPGVELHPSRCAVLLRERHRFVREREAALIDRATQASVRPSQQSSATPGNNGVVPVGLRRPCLACYGCMNVLPRARFVASDLNLEDVHPGLGQRGRFGPALSPCNWMRRCWSCTDRLAGYPVVDRPARDEWERRRMCKLCGEIVYKEQIWESDQDLPPPELAEGKAADADQDVEDREVQEQARKGCPACLDRLDEELAKERRAAAIAATGLELEAVEASAGEEGKGKGKGKAAALAGVVSVDYAFIAAVRSAQDARVGRVRARWKAVRQERSVRDAAQARQEVLKKSGDGGRGLRSPGSLLIPLHQRRGSYGAVASGLGGAIRRSFDSWQGKAASDAGAGVDDPAPRSSGNSRSPSPPSPSIMARLERRLRAGNMSAAERMLYRRVVGDRLLGERRDQQQQEQHEMQELRGDSVAERSDGEGSAGRSATPPHSGSLEWIRRILGSLRDTERV